MRRFATAFLLSISALALSACESPPQSPGTGSPILPGDPPAGGGDGGDNDGGSDETTLGPSCVSSDANRQCIGVKYVAYTSGSTPVISQAQAIAALQQVNTIWAACNIAFQLEKFEVVDPFDYGLSYGSSSQSETSSIRRAFADSETFLVAATGPWSSSTIAWTQLPGAGPYGVVVTGDYADHTVAIAHEIGHYMGLDHHSTLGNVMYSIVYPTDTAVTSAQCGSTRSVNSRYWSAMLR